VSRPGRPKVVARAESQRARILEAAQKCFVERGFHAATMANIAETAGMSAGLIYRYFASKQAIVLAIIDRELEHRRNRIASLRPGMDYMAALVKTFRDYQLPPGECPNAALFLEMSVEATREPQVGAAARGADRRAREDFKAWLARGRKDEGLGLRARDAEALSLLMQIVVDGLAVRSAREPDLEGARLRKALAPIVALLR